MKIKKLFPLLVLSAPLLLASCSVGDLANIIDNGSTVTDVDNTTSTNTGTTSTSVTTATNITVSDDNIDGKFSLVDESGNTLSATNKVYTITTSGVYVASGKLSEGQIKVDVTDGEVEIDLEGVSISNSSVSPIYVVDASEVEIKAKNGTNNYVYDNRTTEYAGTTTDDGIGAIFSNNGDLKFTGKGSLYIHSYNNSGIHGKDNVKVKNLTLAIEADNNGIRGNDKITIEENPTIDIYCGNNGLITSSTDMGSSAQHGYIYINGGTLLINSYGDAIDASYAVEIGTSTDSDGVTYSPVITAYTEVYSSYQYSSSSKSAPGGGMGGQGGPGGSGSNGFGPGGGTMGNSSSSDKADESAKGIKACESINITAGEIYLQTHDDGIHGNKTSDNTTITFDNGDTSNGDVTISGGTIEIYASDDGVHADGTLNIKGGYTEVTMSHEGIEGNIINMSGGTVVVDPAYNTNDEKGVSIITDDAVNASSQINISGGYLDAAVNPNANDTDCIDSNGTYKQTGGVVIARGPNQEMSSVLDCDGSISMSGGTFIGCGYVPSISKSNMSSYSLSLASQGSHTVKINGTSYKFTNQYSYSGTTCYSSVSVTA